MTRNSGNSLTCGGEITICTSMIRLLCWAGIRKALANGDRCIGRGDKRSKVFCTLIGTIKSIDDFYSNISEWDLLSFSVFYIKIKLKILKNKFDKIKTNKQRINK